MRFLAVIVYPNTFFSINGSASILYFPSDKGGGISSDSLQFLTIILFDSTLTSHFILERKNEKLHEKYQETRRLLTVKS